MKLINLLVISTLLGAMACMAPGGAGGGTDIGGRMALSESDSNGSVSSGSTGNQWCGPSPGREANTEFTTPMIKDAGGPDASSTGVECHRNFGECGQPEVTREDAEIFHDAVNFDESYQHPDDFDDDGIEDNFDNCPKVPNPEQFDSDGDEVGDLCDNCREVNNADQFDLDGDRKGDVCDPDRDEDGIMNDIDNCPDSFNPKVDDFQADLDGDGLGDACDDDIDGDAEKNLVDPCPAKAGVKGLEEVELDRDDCFPDADGDGVDDFKDNCPRVANANQDNMDEDEWGDACDPDIDGDGVMNGRDNCREVHNVEQKDLDRDGSGDVCDMAFCYVVLGDEENCLDPEAALQVYGPNVVTDAGAPTRLRLFANRQNQALKYTWTIVDGPDGHGGEIAEPTGRVDASSPYEYRYNQVPTFRGTPGRYTLKISAESMEAEAEAEATMAGVSVAEYRAQVFVRPCSD